MNMDGVSEFRFVVETPLYGETVEFYAGALGLRVDHDWDHGPARRGTLFSAGGAMVEVLADPERPASGRGAGRLMIEVADARAEYARLGELGTVAIAPPREESWGHLTLSLADPNGIEVLLFEKLAG